MSFNIALSGINASQKDLDTTANNISNVKTTGFKQSRAEFADVYASSIFNAGNTKVGDGVLTSSVAQQFSQGTLEFTDNSLDMAISGNGFFATTDGLGSRDLTYTRSGAFKLNDDKFIVDNQGNYLQGYQVDRNSGATTSTSLATTQPIRIPDVAGAPQSTNNIYTAFNVDARLTPIDGTATPFDPNTATTYHSSTSATVYDSLGESHVLSTYYVKRGQNDWDVYATFDGQEIDLAPTGSGTASATNSVNGFSGLNVQFLGNGEPDLPAGQTTFDPGTLDLAGAGPSGPYLDNGADPQTIQFNFQDQTGTTTPTQFASDFEVTTLDQDGTTVGRLTNVDIGKDGLIAATYSNGDVQYLGQVSVVRFANEQGLTQIGGTKWRQSIDSGEPLAGEANSGTFGAIEASALENSNVNLTKELVDLITAQRNFQANSRSLEVNNTINQAILQIR
ncbi:flagellar hook protein FlgE [Idiomarina sp. UBA3162]|uniref:flagellar hook protein FlgE n=1 Tax=unclassified Idiomarina TaxID=2614829 RepID=UPI000C900F67|nr:flagellar hook protein FlgE [Idiomarina sp. UBA3162]MAD53029.1 flagellar hook protein FlgE [Idiomarinaceae bacterium]|tara:strand:+ start:3400 stop:4746 length:1347 start_codon:yes stop_codon:yes gene_type:complete